MLTQLFNIWVISSFPFSFPHKGHKVYIFYKLGMNIFEVKNIRPVFRDILDMTIYMMFSFTSKLKIFCHVLDIYYWI